MDGAEIHHSKNDLKKYQKVDNRFMFVNSGYNLRPTDIQAAIGLNQLKN